MRQKLFGKIVAALETEKAGKRAERLAIGRQGMGLLVGHHLQAVLDTAQEVIGRDERVTRLGIDPATRGERAKRRHGLAAAHLAMAAASDELLRLGKELDLADAAAAELDVVTLDRDLAM